MQRSQFAFVCMYVCMYIRHTLIAWARFLWSRPQTTSHVAGAILYVTGPTWRRSTCEKDCARTEWGTSSPSVIVLESEDGNKETLHQKRVRQRCKI